LARSAGLALKSPIIVKVVTMIVELANPAKNLKMVQLPSSVAKPMLKQHTNMLHRPSSATFLLPILSAKNPQNMPVVPPKAYAQSKMDRRYEVDRFPQ
jgi:hypothetical protein